MVIIKYSIGITFGVMNGLSCDNGNFARIENIALANKTFKYSQCVHLVIQKSYPLCTREGIDLK